MIGQDQYRHINTHLNQKLHDKPFLIAAHRGISNGNIIENTIPAMIAAQRSGADIIEIDVIRSTDGKFYLFHDGNENRLLHLKENIKTLSSHEIEQLTYYNTIGHPTTYKVEKLSSFLQHMPENTLINIDRSWEYWDTLLPYLDQFNLEKNILLKSPVRKEYLDKLAGYPNKFMYFPILWNTNEWNIIKSYTSTINIVGVELIAVQKQDPFFQTDWITKIKEKNLFIFINAIRLHDHSVLYGGLDDDLSVIKKPDLGWGEIIQKGGNIIQTDWTSLLHDYRHTLQS